jgi:hypothetical protein
MSPKKRGEGAQVEISAVRRDTHYGLAEEILIVNERAHYRDN